MGCWQQCSQTVFAINITCIIVFFSANIIWSCLAPLHLIWLYYSMGNVQEMRYAMVFVQVGMECVLNSGNLLLQWILLISLALLVGNVRTHTELHALTCLESFLVRQCCSYEHPSWAVVWQKLRGNHPLDSMGDWSRLLEWKKDQVCICCDHSVWLCTVAVVVVECTHSVELWTLTVGFMGIYY